MPEPDPESSVMNEIVVRPVANAALSTLRLTFEGWLQGNDYSGVCRIYHLAISRLHLFCPPSAFGQ
jgi:hypothetical protein